MDEAYFDLGGPVEEYFDLDAADPEPEVVPAVAQAHEAEDYFGLDDARPVARGRAKLAAGIVRHTQAWSDALRAARAQPSISINDKFAKLADGFDMMVWRHGDTVDRGKKTSAEPKQWCHANTLTAQGLIQGAVQEIGKGAQAHTAEVGVSSTRRRLEVLTTASSMCWRLLKQGACKARDSIMNMAQPTEKARAVVVSRHLDTTPIFMRFGALEPTIAPHARYFVPVEEMVTTNGQQYKSIRWKTVSFEEYRGTNVHKPCHSGVLEVLGSTLAVTHVTYADPSNWRDTYQR